MKRQFQINFMALLHVLSATHSPPTWEELLHGSRIPPLCNLQPLLLIMWTHICGTFRSAADTWPCYQWQFVLSPGNINTCPWLQLVFGSGRLITSCETVWWCLRVAAEEDEVTISWPLSFSACKHKINRRFHKWLSLWSEHKFMGWFQALPLLLVLLHC